MHRLKRLFIFLLLTAGGLSLEAQGPYNRAYVRFNIDVSMNANSTGAGLAALMMKGSSMEIAVSVHKSFVSLDMNMMAMTVVVDEKKEKGMILVKSPRKKQALILDKDTYRLLKLFGSLKTEKKEIEYLDDTRNINGFLCRHARVVKIKDDSTETVYDYYYTQDISAVQAPSEYLTDLPGFPLLIESKNERMTIRMTLDKLELEKQVPKKRFRIKAPRDYTVVPIGEFEGFGGG